MPEPLLKAHGLTKQYGQVKALQGADFDVEPGEVLVIDGEGLRSLRPFEPAPPRSWSPPTLVGYVDRSRSLSHPAPPHTEEPTFTFFYLGVNSA